MRNAGLAGEFHNEPIDPRCSMPAFHPPIAARFQPFLTAEEHLGADSLACCRVCLEPIGRRRLALVPSTLYCEPCQAHHEQQQPLAVRRLTFSIQKGIPL
jgi:hypothetical protein